MPKPHLKTERSLNPGVPGVGCEGSGVYKGSAGNDRGMSYLWLVGNGVMGYNYNYYYYHSSIPY